MKERVNKIKIELENLHGWKNLDCEDKKGFVDHLIKDVLLILDEHKKIEMKFNETLLSKELLLSYGFLNLGTSYMRRNDYSKGSRELIFWFDKDDNRYNIKVSNSWYKIENIGQLKKLYFSLVGSELQLLEAGI